MIRRTALFRGVRLGVVDPEPLRRFYLESLALPEVATERTGFAVQVGETTLEFSPATGSAGGGAPHHFAFNIPRDRLEAARDWLSERIELLPNPDGGHVFPFPDWDAQALYALDPGGNIVEWIARHALSNEAGESSAGDESAAAEFGPEQMLEVSEVGVVTGNVPVYTATLRAGLGLRGYRPASPDFAPIGDERGLFIIAEQGRPWFPTETPAAPAPVEVRIDAAGREKRRFAPAGGMLRVRLD